MWKTGSIRWLLGTSVAIWFGAEVVNGQEAEEKELPSEVEEEKATRLIPTFVTLHADDQPLEEIVASITEQTGVKVALLRSNRAGSPRVTIHIEREPFWLALRQLCQKCGYEPRERMQSDGITLHDSRNRWSDCPVDQFGCFMMVFEKAQSSHTVNYGSGDAQHTLTLSANLYSDPRIEIKSIRNVNVTEATDDRGNELSQNLGGRLGFMGGRGLGDQLIHRVSASLRHPAEIGDVLVSIKGTVEVEILEEVESIEFDDFSELPVLASLGGAEIKVTAFDLDEDNCHIAVTVEKYGEVGLAPPDVKPLDEDGKVLSSGSSSSSSSNGVFKISKTVRFGGGFGGEPIKPPVKLQLTFPTESRTVSVPFEGKDLPLPPR